MMRAAAAAALAAGSIAFSAPLVAGEQGASPPPFTSPRATAPRVIGADGASPPPFTAPRATAPRVIGRDDLAARVRKALAARCLAKGTVGVAAISVGTDDTVLALDAAAPMILASNTKLLTTNAALSILGPSFEFTTRVFAQGEIEADGTLQGDLLVKGDGDPDPIATDGTSRLAASLADIVARAGVRRVNGRLVVDDTIFDRDAVAPGWPRDQISQDYCAPVSGFSLQENTIRFQTIPAGSVGAPATVRMFPPNDVFRLDVGVATVGEPKQHLINVPAPIQPGVLAVRGKVSAGATTEPFWVPVADPSRVAALLLEDRLKRSGVTIAGGAVLASAPVAPTGKELGAATTPLRDALVKLGKESTNVLAEHVYKRVGAQVEGRGTFEAGGRATIAALERRGIAPADARSVDGSGLSRGNRYAPLQVARLLAAIYRDGGAARDLLLEMLPIAGTDGTLEHRMTQPQYRGRVRAKTGYIAKVSALSGFAQTDAGEIIAFSIVMNGFTGSNRDVKDVQDEVAKLFVDLDGTKP